MVRLTKEVRKKILDQNEGFKKKTYYEERNFQEERIYMISDGQLNICNVGKTSWADSRYKNEWVADNDEIHRFLYKYQNEMNLDGLK